MLCAGWLISTVVALECDLGRAAAVGQGEVDVGAEAQQDLCRSLLPSYYGQKYILGFGKFHGKFFSCSNYKVRVCFARHHPGDVDAAGATHHGQGGDEAGLRPGGEQRHRVKRHREAH